MDVEYPPSSLPSSRRIFPSIIIVTELITSIIFSLLFVIFLLNFFNLIRLDSYSPLFAPLPHYQEVTQQYVTLTDPEAIFLTYLHDNITPAYQPVSQVQNSIIKGAFVYKWTLSSDPTSYSVQVTFSPTSKRITKILLTKTFRNLPMAITSSAANNLVTQYFLHVGQLLSWHCATKTDNTHICVTSVQTEHIKRSYLVSDLPGTHDVLLLACLVPQGTALFAQHNCFNY